MKGQSLLSGGRLIVAKEGASALLTGFGPTAVGYLVQVRIYSARSRHTTSHTTYCHRVT